jgi:hypothetical protein
VIDVRRAVGTAAAYCAAAAAFGYAAVSLYWTAGGTVLLRTVGGTMEELARHGGLLALTLGLAAVILKVACGLLALALVRPERLGAGMTRSLLLPAAILASALLACYGAVQVSVGALVLADALHPAWSVDRTALGWHVGVWDMWFLVWGILLAVATVSYWRQTAARSVS